MIVQSLPANALATVEELRKLFFLTIQDRSLQEAHSGKTTLNISMLAEEFTHLQMTHLTETIS